MDRYAAVQAAVAVLTAVYIIGGTAVRCRYARSACSTWYILGVYILYSHFVKIYVRRVVKDNILL